MPSLPRYTPRAVAVAATLSSLSLPIAHAQTPARSAPAAAAAVPASLYGSLAWRNVGPNRGGRSIAVTGTTARPLEYYFGAAGGGVW